MSNVIDEKIVEMRFDNQDFEKNVKESMSTLKKLRESLNFDGAEKSFEPLQLATEGLDFNNLSEGIDKATSNYKSFLDTVGDVWAIKKAVQAIDGLYNTVIRSVKAMSVDQFSAGWDKYAQKTQAVQTIISATHKSIDEVNEALEMLNWFSDETSYSFTDMTDSIGKFTSVGVDLNTAVKAVMGISTWAAKSGQDRAQASRAMYNLAQAMSLGAVKSQDWRSIESANMATTEFKQAALDAAVAVGTLRKQGDKYLTVTKGTEVTVSNFNNTLQEGWFTTEALLKTLGRYGGYAEDLYHFMQDSNGEFATANQAMEAYTGTVDELGRSAFAAGQEATSLTQAIEATKDAVSSGWMNIFEVIFGNYEEAKKSWTKLSLDLWDIFAGGFSYHKDFLKDALSKTGRDFFNDTLKEIGISSDTFYKSVEKVMRFNGYDFSIWEGKYDTPLDALKNETFWRTPEIITQTMDLVNSTLSLQNDSVIKNTENWRALIQGVEEYGGSAEAVQREIIKVLAEEGVDMEALIKQYGSFEAAVVNSKVVSGDVLGKAFGNLGKTALDYSRTIEGGNLTMKEFDQIYTDVFLGKYGSGTDRVEAFTKANLDYAKVQELINKRARGETITAEDLMGLRLEETQQVENLADFYNQLGETYQFAGKNAQELAQLILESGTDANWMVNNLDGMTGRELIFDTILAPLENLSSILYAVREAWDETFFQNPVGLLKTIANINVFIHSLDLSEDRIQDIHDAFAGLFSILKVVGGLIGATFKLFKPAFSNIPKFLNITVRLLGIAGRAISAITDFLMVDIGRGFDKLKEIFSKVPEFFGNLIEPLKEKFLSLFEDDEGANKFLETFDKVKQVFDLIKSKASEIRKIIKSVFFIDKDSVDPNAIKAGLFDKIYEVYTKLLPIINEIKQKINDLFGPQIEKAKQVIEGIKEKFESVKRIVTDLIDSIRRFFGGGESDELIRGSLDGEGSHRRKKSKTGELVDKLIPAYGLSRLDILKNYLNFFKQKFMDLISFSPTLTKIFSKIFGIGDRIKGSLQNSPIFTKIKDFFSAKISPKLGKGLNFVKEKFGAIKDSVTKSNFFGKIKEFFSTKVSPNFQKGLNYVKEKFGALKNTIANSSLVDKIKKFFSQKISSNLEKGLESVKEKFNSLKESFLNNSFVSEILNILKPLKEGVAELFRNAPKRFSKLAEILNSILDSIFGKKKSGGKSSSILDMIGVMIFGEKWETISKYISYARELISKKISNIWEFIKTNAGSFLNWVSKHKIAAGAGGLGILGAILGIKSLREAQGMAKGLIKAITTFFGSGGNMFKAVEAFVHNMDSAQNGVKKKSFTESFLEFSKAVALIAGSIFVLGNMDSIKALKGAAYVGAIIGAIAIAMKSLEKIKGLQGGDKSPLESISKMILEMAGIIVVFSRIDFNKGLKGVLGIGAIFVILLKAFEMLSKNGTNVNLGKDVLDGLTTAIKNMAGVVTVMSRIDFWKAAKGFIGLTAIMTALGVFLVLVSKYGTAITTAKETIEAISNVLKVFSGIIIALGNMNPEKMIQGIIGLYAVVVALGGLLVAIGKLGGQIAIGAGVLLAIGGVVAILSGIVWGLSKVENIQNGIIALAEIVGTFTLIGIAMAGFAVIGAPAIIGAGLFALFAAEIAAITVAIRNIVSNIQGLPEVAEGLSSFATKLEPFIESCERLHNINFGRAVADMTAALTVLFAGSFTGMLVQHFTGHSVFEALGNELENLGQALRRFVDGLFDLDEATDKDVDVDTDKIKNAFSIIPQLADIMKMDFSQTSTIAGFFRGNLSTFASSVKDLGTGFAAFASSITESALFETSSKVPSEGKVDSKISQINSVIDIIERLAAIEVPTRFSVSGISIPIFGLVKGKASNTFTGLGEDLKTFAGKNGFGGFIDTLVTSDLFTKTFGKIKEDDGTVNTNIQTVASALVIIERLAAIEVPTSFSAAGGAITIPFLPALGFVNGTVSNDFASWGQDLANFADKETGFVSFIDSIIDSKLFSSGITGLEDQSANVDANIAAIQSAIGIIDSLSKIVPPKQFEYSVGLKFLSALGFSGKVSNDFASLGEDLKAFGGEDGFVGFMKQIVESGIFKEKLETPEDTSNIDQINAAIDIIDRLAQLKVPTYFSVDVGIPILNSLGKFSIKANSSLATFGSDLNQFASEDGFIGFVREILDSELFTGEITFKNGSIENATGNLAAISAAVDIIATLASIDPPVVESSWFTNLLNKGDKSLETLGEDLPDFATGVLGFINVLNSKDVEGNYQIDDKIIGRVEQAIGIINKLVGIQMPKERGWLDTFSLGAFAGDFTLIGNALNTFIGQMTAYTDFSDFKTDSTAVDVAVKALDVLKELIAIEIPDSGNFWEKFFGISDSLENYSKGVDAIGPALRNVIVSLNGLDSEGNKIDSFQFTQEHIDKVLAVIPIIRELASIPLYNIGSIANNWDKIPEFGTQLRDMIINFSSAMESGEKIDDTKVDSILKILPILDTLSLVSDRIYLQGYKDFGKFAESASSIVKPLMDFITNIQNGLNELKEESIDFDQINTVLSLVSSVASILQSDSEYSMDTFKGETIIAKLGRDISGLAQRVNENVLDETAVKRITDLIDKLFESDETSFHTFVENLNTDLITLNATLSTIETDFYKLGMNIAKGLADGMDAGNTIYVQPAATRLGTSALGATEESVDSHSPSKEFEKIGKYIDEGLAIGIDGNARLAEVAAENLGNATLTPFKDFKNKINKISGLRDIDFGKELFGFIEFDDQDILSSLTAPLKGSLNKDGSETGGTFANGFFDSIFSIFKRDGEDISDIAEETAEDTAAGIVEGTYTGANDKSKEELEEATQDDIAGVADVTINEFESRKESMIKSARDLVKKLAEAVQENSKLFADAGRALGGVMHQGLIEGLDQEKLQYLAAIMKALEAFSSGASETYVARFQQSMEGISEILNNLDIDPEKLSILTNFLTAMTQFDMSNLTIDSGVLSTFIAAIVSSISENSEEIRTAMNALATLMIEVLETYEGKFYSKGSELIHELAEGMISGIEYATNAVSIICGAILDAFDSMGKEQIGKEGETFMQEFAQGMTSEAAKESIADAIDKVFNGSEETTSERVEEVDEEGRVTVSGVQVKTEEGKSVGQKFGEQFVQDFKESVTGSGALQETIDAIGESFTSLSTSVTELTESTDMTGFITSMSSELETAKTELTPAADKLKSLISGIVPDGQGSVTAMMNGMITAFYNTGKVAEVVAAAQWFAEQVSSALSGAWQINSPSKVTRKMGYSLIEGVKMGIESKGHTAVESMGKFAEDVVSAGQEAFSENDDSALKDTASILSNILDLIDEDFDADPVISPVVDLSGIQRGAADIDSILSRNHAYEISARMSRQQQEAFLQNGLDGQSKNGSSIYNFTQNNYSPKALSRLEIYRQTKNQFAMLKGVGK